MKLSKLMICVGLLGAALQLCGQQPNSATQAMVHQRLTSKPALGGASAHPMGLDYSVLYAFTGAEDGANPFAGVVQDDQGNLYGTNPDGGNLSDCAGALGTGCGVVFKLSPDGTLTVLHTFTNGSDGSSPQATLVLDPDGNLYGMTLYSTSAVTGGCSCGVIFKIDAHGNFSVLHAFAGGTADGSFPSYGGLVRDNAGNLYGVTQGGGGSGCRGIGCGVVFKLDTNNHLTVLYSFAGQPDGENPYGRLTLGTDGNIYGTTYSGGTFGQGTVFKLSSHQDGTWTESLLHSFNGYDGGLLFAGVVRDDNGNLYGTSSNGGPSHHGLVFKIDKDGNESTFYSFTGGADGSYDTFPNGDLILDQHGNLYGTTFFSYGAVFGGVVFKLDPTGKETVLHDFIPVAGGINPYAGLFRDRNGNLYGTTGYGGDTASPQGWCGGFGCGVVFKISACSTSHCQGNGND